eukprot:806384-Alexandrium_andersonii.AAC.1
MEAHLANSPPKPVNSAKQSQLAPSEKKTAKKKKDQKPKQASFGKRKRRTTATEPEASTGKPSRRTTATDPEASSTQWTGDDDIITVCGFEVPASMPKPCLPTEGCKGTKSYTLPAASQRPEAPHVSWLANGGVAAAWAIARERSNWPDEDA